MHTYIIKLIRFNYKKYIIIYIEAYILSVFNNIHNIKVDLYFTLNY